MEIGGYVAEGETGRLGDWETGRLGVELKLVDTPSPLGGRTGWGQLEETG